MYKLKHVNESEWSLEIENVKTPLVASLKQVCKFAVELGFEMEEVEAAVNEMAWMEHDVAHFGVFKRFIFTSDLNGKAA